MLIAQSYLTLCDFMDCSPPGSSVHGIFQSRILEWVSIPFSRGSHRPRDWTPVSCIAGRFFTIWATREAHIHAIHEARHHANWCEGWDGCGMVHRATRKSRDFQSTDFLKSAYLILHIRLWSALGSSKELFRTAKPASFLWVKLGHILEPPLFQLRAFAPATVSAWSIPPALGAQPFPGPPAHCLLMYLLPSLPLLLFDISVFRCYRLNFRIPDSIMMSSMLDKTLSILVMIISRIWRW